MPDTNVAPATVDALDPDRFLEDYLTPRQPVLVRRALAHWRWAPPWDLVVLRERFGDRRVPLYDTLFSLQRLSTFGSYLDTYCGDRPAAASDEPPYLRWFTRQRAEPMPWADTAFRDLQDEWEMPGWLPTSGYVFPPTVGTVDAARDPFPAKGLFVCGRGGSTRFHADPWASDACLCQATGDKRVVMVPPDTVAQPEEATPHFDEVLYPGDALYIPAAWQHTAIALSDSVSITWNFVHEVHEEQFRRHLADHAADDPTVLYFLGLGSTA